jgi:hypothetical protein
MSIEQIVSLTAICAGFIVFAVVLAWGDFQTRHIRHNHAAKSSDAQLQRLKSAAAAPAPSLQTAAAQPAK